MSEEILNIDHHVKQLVLKALNKFRYLTEACRALGISERSLANYRQRYNIQHNDHTNQYSIIQNKKHATV